MQVPFTPELSDTIKMLSQVSPVVEEYVNSLEYIYDTDGIDNLSEEGILTQCYFILINELKSRGIVFHCDDEELFSSWYEAERIYLLYKWVLLHNLIPSLKRIPNIIEQIENIINDTHTDNLLEDLYNVCLPYNDTISPIQKLFPLLHTTEEFRHTLKYALSQIEYTPYEFTIPVEEIKKYLQAMTESITRANKAYKLLSKHGILAILTEEELAYISKEMREYDLDKLSPTNISNYAWTYMVQSKVEDGTIEELQKEQYDKLEYEHHTTNTHHIEYYLLNKDIPVDNKACVLLAIACLEDTPLATIEKAKKCIYHGNDVFTPINLPFFKKCISVLAKIGV